MRCDWIKRNQRDDRTGIAHAETALQVKRERDEAIEFLRIVLLGFTPDPGIPDLDDEQPIHVSITLGDYRRIRRLLWHI